MTVRAISYGGGVQSTALLVLAAQREIDFPLALFSNTGDDSEHPATLEYFHEVARPFAENNGIDLRELRKRPRGAEKTLWQTLTDPSSRSIDIPMRMSGSGSPGHRTCTTQFKIKRIASHLKHMGATDDDPAVCALGISIDEFQRMRTESGFAWQTLTYPLIDRRFDRAACVGIIERAGLPIPPKSSCFFCPFKTLTQWRKQRRDEPELFALSVSLERQLSERHIALGRDAIYLTSALRPLDEAVGDHDQLDLFGDGATCDIGGYCMA